MTPEEKKAYSDWKSGKIKRAQLKEVLIGLGVDAEFVEWEIEDFDLADLNRKMKNYKKNPEAACNAAITCLSRYGHSRGYGGTEEELEAFFANEEKWARLTNETNPNEYT